MNASFYFKIAKTNIKNNRKIYFPYILTSICMVMIMYVVSFLANDPMIAKKFAGGATLQGLLKLGVYIIMIFSALFLFYTNSFITKRRKREFGLMSVLGMGKKNISLVMLWENIIVDFTSIAVGLVLGLLLSKLAQGVLFNILGESAAPLDFSVNLTDMLMTVLVFIVIFAVIFFDSIRQITFTNTIDLLHSSNKGEKEPKANYIMAVIGVVFLGVGYALSQLVQQAYSAISLFFVAVIFVIVGTYALFIAGSVALAKVLKKNKAYYYKPSHFVSVSGMTYRMKRNGAGLASICILSTMVLVMLSTTVCMFAGVEKTSQLRYPMDVTTMIGLSNSTEEECAVFEAEMHKKADNLGVKIEREVEYNTWNAYVEDKNTGVFRTGEASSEINPVQLNFFSIDAYNDTSLTGEKISLGDGEALILTYDCEYSFDTFEINDVKLSVKEVKPTNGNFTFLATLFSNSIPQILVFTNDSAAELYRQVKNVSEGEKCYVNRYIGWDVSDCDDETLDQLCSDIRQIWLDGNTAENTDWTLSTVYTDTYVNDFNYQVATYGGLFFLAIILGLVFISGTVLIMYYKQVTEGYEDAERYEIMKKVGMTEREIKKSINSQILTVFFAPLIAAGVHIAFAYNMIKLILRVMVAAAGSAFFYTTLICYAVFAVFYIAVYLITSKAYYRTISYGKTAALN
ncbi:MAG: ABC transporter permease [Eubacteriales bacterium]|nr:ABC transporter permease [Eubacteriales bacterium]